MNRRVVVTGLGAITPIGNNVPEFWSAVKQQKVGIGEITHFDATDYKCHLAAEVKDFDAKNIWISALQREWKHSVSLP